MSALLSDLAGALAPLLNPKRDLIDSVRFVGSKTDLQAFASDGHVLALVTVLGDYSHIGNVTLPGEIARMLAYRDWTSNPWDDPEENRHLTAEKHFRPFREGDLTLRMILKVLPKSRAPEPAAAWFLGAAIATLGTVVRRLGLFVQFGGGPHEDGAMRIDSPPRLHSGGGDELLWVSLAIMPGKREGRVE